MPPIDLLGLAALLGAGLVLFYLLVYLNTMRRLVRPPRKTYAVAVARNRPGDPSELVGQRAHESWTVRARGRDIDCWDIAGDDPAGPTIVFCHGWGDSRIGALVRVPYLAPRARRLIAFDWPRNGEADGKFTLGVREHEDVLAVIERVEGPVVLHGWSLGAGVAIAAAASCERVSGVVAESPYRHAITPARNVIRMMSMPHRGVLPVAMWTLGTRFGVGPGWAHFDRAEIVQDAACPLLVIHGDADDICPISDGKDIAAAVPSGSFTAIEGAGHSNLWTPDYVDAVSDAVLDWLPTISA